MKKLKLTINGELKIFDLPENGDYKVEVVNKYVPQVDDCVKVECDKTKFYWFKVKNVSNTKVDFSLAIEDDLYILKGGIFAINNNRIFTQITHEELKAKYVEGGYEWDYETDTIKPLKWMPKDGDEVWSLNYIFEPVKNIFNKDNIILKPLAEKGFLFKTKAECQKFSEHCLSYINNKK